MASRGSSIYKGSDLIHEYSCSKCEENDLNTEAQHFCPECEHYLCDKCVGIHGDYFKKHVVYGRDDIQKWAEFSMDRCAQHGKELEVHCDDHQELCCCVCVALNHRLCSSISHLPDLARGFHCTSEFKQLPAAVEKMRIRLDELKNDRLKEQASLNDSYKNSIAEIKALRKEINQILDKLEKRTVENLESIMEDLEKSIKDDLATFTRMHDQLGAMIEQFKQFTDKNKESSSYIGFTKCQSKLSEANSLVREIRGKKGMKFKCDESGLLFLRNLNSFGNVESVRKTDSYHVFKAQSSSLYKVKKKKDKQNCSIEGIFELPSGKVVIADYNNDKVKLLNKQFEVIGYCHLPAPQHLCHITDNDIAVAVSEFNTNEVHLLTVTKGKIKAMRKFTTDHLCCTIAHHQGQLYVGSNNALYLYTMDGSLIKTIYEDNTSMHTVYKCVVSPDGERIFVTHFTASRLLTLDTSGQVLSTVEDPDLQSPSGLCVSPSGHVFVCGFESNALVQVDQEGRKVSTVARLADGVLYPRSVWFKEQNSTLIVGNLGDNIHVVKLC
ncbi:uncharacterized protein LOC128218033 [Mya arenaria]|uniref:uncharacterized protein LOC128218033 n=1 Tax=Mya arenaria TaxID=6604 RepID=UPI0022E53B69|nr:uncharacterized protein LOC128218033 [Mya arenaria]